MKPYYSDDTVTLHHGDALTVLREMPDASVHSVVTSPPYYGLRDYGVDGQLGLEATPAEYVAALTGVFDQVRRVLRPNGTCWLNLGDGYAGRANAGRAFTKNRGRNVQSVGYPAQRNLLADTPYKGLLGIPWRVALALQDQGWILRNAVVWSKPNAMPESVTDRLATRHELLFLLTRSPSYYFDLDAIREPLAHPDAVGRGIVFGGANPDVGARRGATYAKDATVGRNPGDVWTIPTAPFPGAHFATFPSEIPRRCILAGCPAGGTVLDPFHGSGTTGMVAQRTGRRYIGIDLSREYLDLSLRTRLADAALPIDGGAA